ncbi:MAG TPA: GntR family transcriptional regulator [Solirubrobacterales bacterium]
MAQQPEPGTVQELARGDDLPVGANLHWRLEALIRSGHLPANERLPGVREFAAGAGINVNTARSVYRRLENDGLTVSRQGLGTFVAPHPPVSPALEDLAAHVAGEAIALGIDPRELARALYAGSSPGDPFSERPSDELVVSPRTEEEARSARAELRGQIASLEARLAAYPGSGPKGPAPRPHMVPRIAPIDELEAVRDDLIARLRRAQAAAEKQSERHESARRWREDALANPSAHRWESVSNEDLSEPGCGSVAVRPRWGPVGALMDWWRVKISSGCP